MGPVPGGLLTTFLPLPPARTLLVPLGRQMGFGVSLSWLLCVGGMGGVFSVGGQGSGSRPGLSRSPSSGLTCGGPLSSSGPAHLGLTDVVGGRSCSQGRGPGSCPLPPGHHLGG